MPHIILFYNMFS